MSWVSGSSSVRGGCSTRASHQSRPSTLTRPAAYATPICTRWPSAYRDHARVVQPQLRRRFRTYPSLRPKRKPTPDARRVGRSSPVAPCTRSSSASPTRRPPPPAATSPEHGTARQPYVHYSRLTRARDVLCELGPAVLVATGIAPTAAEPAIPLVAERSSHRPTRWHLPRRRWSRGQLAGSDPNAMVHGDRRRRVVLSARFRPGAGPRASRERSGCVT